MPKISDDTIRAVEDAADIVEVVKDILGSYDNNSNPGGLRKKGVNYTALCPFHDDHNDCNFMVRPRNVSKSPNTFKCFVCGEKGGPVQFLMKHEHMSFPDAIRWLGKKFDIPVDDVPVDWTPPPPRPVPPPLPTLILPRRMVKERTGNLVGDPLYEWIKALPWDSAQRARLLPTFRDYCVGHAVIQQQYKRHDFTVFWQVDRDGNPRTAHYMKYKPNGHRMHREDDRYNTDWFHSLLDRGGYTQYYDATKQEPRQCLFGEHLMKRYPQAPVCIVESEKTAIIMAIAYGNHPLQLWMACCGLGNITRDRLEPIIRERRRIVLYPDRDSIEQWKIKAEQLHYERVIINTTPVTKWWKPEDGDKADCADVLVRMIQENAKAGKYFDKQLIDRLNNEKE